ncbi:hypothetical protein Tco_0327725 [Tanacetum coccineum]
MTGNVLPNAPTARGLAIWPEIAEASLLLPTTTREPKGPIREFSLALSARNGNDVGTAGTNPNSNVVTGTFLLNNYYASILFDTGVDRSFVSTAFSSLIDIIPATLDHGYDVELVDDEPLAIPLYEIHIDDKLNLIEEPVKIMDREVKRLKKSRIPIVKVRWNSRRGPEFTWEREDQMKKKYPHLFVNP